MGLVQGTSRYANHEIGHVLSLCNMASNLDQFAHKQFGRARDVGRGSIWSVTLRDIGLEPTSSGPGREEGHSWRNEESRDSMETMLQNPKGAIVTPDMGTMSCRTCGLTFQDTEARHLHYKSSLHRINLKRKMKCLPVLKEEDTTRKGGSSEAAFDEEDSSDYDDSSSDEDAIAGKEEGSTTIPEEEEVESDSTEKRKQSVVSSEQGTVYWGDYSSKDGVPVTFRVSSQDNDSNDGERKESLWQFSLNTVVLSAWEQIRYGSWEGEGGPNPWNSLRESLAYFSRKPLVCVFILRSGRFAGVIFDGMTVLEHKTLRRYTVRAKAGGGQSSHDKQGGKALSAGAMLRRYGEEALKEDVKRLLSLWKPHMDAAGLILFSIPKTMRSIMFEEGSDAPLRKGDKRVVNVPFMVRLPTFEEAQLIHAKISAIVFTRISSMSNRKAGSSADTTDTGKSLATVPEAPLTVDLGAALEELALENRTRNIARKEEKKLGKLRRAAKKKEESMLAKEFAQNEEEFAESAPPLSKELLGLLTELVTVGKGNAEGKKITDQTLSTIRQVTELSDHTEIAAILRHPDSLRDMHSPLHLAAECGNVSLVEALLMAGSDPGASDGHGRTPYVVSRDKATRDTFRRCRGAIEASRIEEGQEEAAFGVWDWDAAGVGPALTDVIEVARKEAQKEKEKERKKRAKQRKKEAAQVEARKASDFALAKEMQEKEDADEEERRKRDAGICAQCDKSLYQVKVFALQDCKCCSAACVLSLRRRMAAEAAERRFAGK